ncbi:MAG: nucleobase:cation symporter-2 family protein [Lachnospiraceae bacterium]|nr:nucleobase:cation symporter-2 family protein [Lachnospiraceae bacterium]
MSNQKKTASVDNIYRLEGRVPVAKAIPFGFQHVLAMFVANVTPLIIIAGAAIYNGQAFTGLETAQLIQNCMLIAGVGTLIQLYPIWRIGSGLPIVMGLSFTFLAACLTAASQDYGLMVGGIIVGGCIEGVLGLTAKYWRKLIQPIVAGCVVTAIGLSILNVGVSSFASSGKYETGAWQNLLVGTITLACCLAFNVFARGFWRQLNVLFGLIVGYIVSIGFGMVDFSNLKGIVDQLGVFSFPRLFAYTPKFDVGIIASFVIVFLVSAVETIGDTTAACTGALGRDITDKEVSGSLAVDGFISAVAGGVFGVSPITSFSQNVGLLKMTRVVNRFTIMFGALLMILGGLFPPIGAFLSTLPDCVLGGCTVIMFGSIVVAGFEMIAKVGFSHRNMIIVATSLCVGVGVTEVEGFFSGLPSIVGDIFASNMVAGVFVVSLILSLVLPENMGHEM